MDPVTNPGDLERLDGFGFVAADSLLEVCDALSDLGEGATAEVLIDAGASLVSVAANAAEETKRRSLRAMTLGHFARLWRTRAIALEHFVDPALTEACYRLADHLREAIDGRRPAPLELPRLEAVRVGILRRRLDNHAPRHARQLAAAFAFVEHGTPLSSWMVSGPALGLPRETRAHLDALIAEVRGWEAESAAPRRVRFGRIERAASTRPGVRAALAHLDDLQTASEPLEVLRGRASGRFDPDLHQLAVYCPHWLACLTSSSCTTATVDLSEPAAPRVRCMQRDTPCTLKRLAVEVLAETLAEPDDGEAVPIENREALGLWCSTSASRRLIGRLDELGRVLAIGQDPDGRLGWLLTPYERLDLVRVRPMKKGGLKSRRLSKADAELALGRPAHVIAAAILRGQRMFQEQRFGHEGLEALGPALAALAGDGDLFVKVGREIRPLSVELAEPRIEARFDDAGRAEFVVTLAGRQLERGAPGKSWVAQLDTEAATLIVGHVTEAMRLAALTLIGRPPVAVEPKDREALAERLLALDRRVPVAPDDGWLGEAVRAEPRWVLQLVWSRIDASEKALEARLRVRIVPELGALVPGDGERVLPLKRVDTYGEMQLKHVERDFDGERRAAIEVAEALGLAVPGTAAELEWRFIALEEALDFVAEAQAMQAEGRVELVWDSKPLEVHREARADRLQLRLGFRRDWLDISGGYLLDGSELPLAPLLSALRDGKRFVAVDERRFVELSEELARALAPLATLARRKGERLVASPLAAPLVEELGDAGVEVDAPDEWLTMSQRLRESASLEPEVPADLRAELRPYQLAGYRWMARLAHWARGACLADDMGLGKTLQALVLVLRRRRRGATLVVAPTSVVANWIREAGRFAPALEVTPILSGGAIAGALEGAGPGAMLVTTWDLMARNPRLHQGPDGAPWTTVVLDEAHAIKNPRTRRAQAARALESEFVLALTGTPVENRPVELWSLFSVVAPGLLGSYEAFVEAYGRDVQTRTADAARRLSRLIRPFLLRRKKADVAPELPPRSDVRVDVVLTREERDRYQRVRMAAIAELDALGPEAVAGQKGMMRVLAVLTRLRQLACHPRLVDPKAPAQSSKVERLVELAEELSGEGRRMLVFSQFVELLKIVAARFERAGLDFAYLDGSTPGEDRVRAVDRFQSGEVAAFLLSLKAGGVGLNLTAASEVIHLDPWWNPAVEDQASDRAHRIGQERPVTIYRLVSNDTIEEQILGLHGDKREMVAELLTGTGSARALSVADMSALLTEARS